MFKTHDSDSHSVFTTADGHQIKVAKGALSAQMRKQLEKIPMQGYAEGGEVNASTMPEKDPFAELMKGASNQPGNANISETPPAQPAPSQPSGLTFDNIMAQLPSKERLGEIAGAAFSPGPGGAVGALAGASPFPVVGALGPAIGGVIGGGLANPGGALNPQPAAGAAQENQKPRTMAAQATQQAEGESQKSFAEQMKELNDTQMANIKGPIEDYKKAALMAARVQSDIGYLNALSKDSEIYANEVMGQNIKIAQDDYNAKSNAIIKAISERKLDPNRIFANMDTGQHVATSIGLILGGIGGGGKTNMALDFLNKSIDRDIDMQKTSLERDKSLLGYYQKMFGDNMLAETAYRDTVSKSVAAQLEQNAAIYSGDLAKQNALMAAAQLKSQHVGEINTLLANQMKFKMMAGSSSGAGSDLTPAMRGAFIGSDPASIKEASENQGKFAFAASVQNNAIKEMKEVFEKNTLSNRILHPFETQKMLHTLQETIYPQLEKAFAGTVSDKGIEQMKKAFEQELTSGKANLDTMIKVLRQHMQPVLDEYRVKNESMNLPIQSSILRYGYGAPVEGKPLNAQPKKVKHG